MSTSNDPRPHARLACALLSLEGLATGDAFGEQFFVRDSFADLMWTTVSALGDRDTTCAIAGGIVAARVGLTGLPQVWRAAREPLPLAEIAGAEGAAWAASAATS